MEKIFSKMLKGDIEQFHPNIIPHEKIMSDLIGDNWNMDEKEDDILSLKEQIKSIKVDSEKTAGTITN